MGMMSEFKTFVARGNVLDLAVGVIIGAAFGKIVTSLTESVIMPVIGWLMGGENFTNHFILLGQIPAGYKGSPTDYEALKAAGVAMIGYGDFITQVINFIFLAFVVFLIVKLANKAMPPKAAAAAGPSEVDLLTEIRDALKKG
ncbi:MAG: large conductance mechanosensitive channel protein MscL [Sphingomonadales bacterium]|nr:large conductance mechanosensitive channel protein MscL [Sphingomonadales bacterium]MDE2568376.1 large conductance mechanosensitive channel protein MscL [Sphingomonadales bacterium]